MKPARSLTLKREALAELTPADLSGVVAAAGMAEKTQGRICTGIMVGTAMIAGATQIIEIIWTSEAAPDQQV